MHMFNNADHSRCDLPAEDDPHAWTVIYQTYACEHVHRVIGWVGDHRSAITVAAVTAALWHPVLRATPAPAPTGADTGRVGVITDVPEVLRARVEAGEIPTPEEMAAAGVTQLELIDELMPEPVMIAARVTELLEAKGVDVTALLTDSGIHDGMAALVRAGGEELFGQIMAEYPSPSMSPGTGHGE